MSNLHGYLKTWASSVPIYLWNVKLTIEIECWGFNKPRADVYTVYMFQRGVKTIIARVYRAVHALLRAYIAHRTRAPHARTALAHRSPHTFAFGGVNRSPLLSLDKYIYI